MVRSAACELPDKAAWAERAKGDHPAGTPAYDARVQLDRLVRDEEVPAVVPYPVATYDGGGAMIFHGWPAPFTPGIEERIVTEVKRQRPHLLARENAQKNESEESAGISRYRDQKK